MNVADAINARTSFHDGVNHVHEPSQDRENTDELFHFVRVTSYEVCKLLSALDISKATGLDGFAPRLLKIGCRQIAKPLAHIMNLSLFTGSVPSAWKLSRVSPIFKEGAVRILTITGQSLCFQFV